MLSLDVGARVEINLPGTSRHGATTTVFRVKRCDWGTIYGVELASPGGGSPLWFARDELLPEAAIDRLAGLIAEGGKTAS